MMYSLQNAHGLMQVDQLCNQAQTDLLMLNAVTFFFRWFPVEVIFQHFGGKNVFFFPYRVVAAWNHGIYSISNI